MPKHALTFKHLVASSFSSSNQRRDERQRSVNDLIASSRTHRPVVRDTPLQAGGHVNLAVRAWTPEPSVGIIATSSLPVPGEDGTVHPAELLRRAHLSHRQASRSVAGPAPPPSWRQRPAASRDRSAISDDSTRIHAPATTEQLIFAAELFPPTFRYHPQPQPGARRLVEQCLYAVLKHLRDTTPIHLGDDDFDSPIDSSELGDAAGESSTTVPLGSLLEDNLGFLEPHIKLSLLLLSSVQPEQSPLRLSDSAIRSVLTVPPAELPDQLDPLDEPTEADGSTDAEDDWEDAIIAAPELHHLPLTAHPSPVSFLKAVPSLTGLALTSLNLAFSSIADLERLAQVLPGGLRELSLAGCRFKQGREDLKRGLAVLGRRLLVLQMLDLSLLPRGIIDFSALLLPPSQRLPSLRVLGARDGPLMVTLPCNGTLSLDGLHLPVDAKESNTRVRASEQDGQLLAYRSQLMSVIRVAPRHYVDVIWDED